MQNDKTRKFKTNIEIIVTIYIYTDRVAKQVRKNSPTSCKQFTKS